MNPKSGSSAQPADQQPVVLAFLSLLVGVASGFIGASFRLALMRADRLRDALFAWARGEKLQVSCS
jgi:chloride channel protein, CIC family